VVADTGVGMDAETRSRIFTPFFSTRAGNAGGTGLGLSVSMRIVEGHHGTIDVESEPGKGAVFTIRLPIARHSPDGSVQASEAEACVQEVPWDAESDGGAEASLQFRREEAA
jgi:K+-sensing histidine kinase KdpD